MAYIASQSEEEGTADDDGEDTRGWQGAVTENPTPVDASTVSRGGTCDTKQAHQQQIAENQSCTCLSKYSQEVQIRHVPD